MYIGIYFLIFPKKYFTYKPNIWKYFHEIILCANQTKEIIFQCIF